MRNMVYQCQVSLLSLKQKQFLKFVLQTDLENQQEWKERKKNKMRENTKISIKNFPSFTSAYANTITEKEKTRSKPPSKKDLIEFKILLDDFGYSQKRIDNIIENEVTQCKNMREFETLRRTLINRQLNN